MSLTAAVFRLTASRNDRKRDEGLTTPEEILRFDNISYGPDPWWHLLDIYRPKASEGKLPVIIDVHGGGWVYGDKNLYSHYCMDLSRRGFAVVNFNYRLAPRHRFPAGTERPSRISWRGPNRANLAWSPWKVSGPYGLTQ